MKFRDLAKNETTLSPLMENKEKMLTEDVIKNYGIVTIVAFDIISNQDGENYSVFNIAENENIFVNGGAVLNRIFNRAIETYGSIENANKELSKEPLKVKLENSETKSGNTFTKITVV